MARIADLSASQLSRHAFNLYMFQGRHVTGARLIYHALRLDPNEGEGLYCLSDFLAEDGTEQFSAAVLEYALVPGRVTEEESHRVLDFHRFLAKWEWGFSRHSSGNPHLGSEDFRDRSQFVIDEAKWREFLSWVVNMGGSLEGAFRAAHTLVGALGGLLTHISFGKKSPIDEVFHSERFRETPEYGSWLRETTEDLDGLEEHRRKTADPQLARQWPPS